jgi:spore maturation protein CgeB
MSKKRPFTRVKNLDTGKLGTVKDRLSTQFTVDYDDGTFGFLPNSYEDISWERVYEYNKG